MTHRILHHLTTLALLLLCTTATTHAQTPSTLTGHWSGTLDTVHPDGSVDPDQLYLSLDPVNPSASAAGNDPAHLSPATQATLIGNTVTLTIPVNPTVTVQFNLTLQGDHLRGTATGLPGTTDVQSCGDRMSLLLGYSDHGGTPCPSKRGSHPSNRETRMHAAI